MKNPDQKGRTMHEVSVSYFKNNVKVSALWRYYLEKEAIKMYQAAINKYKVSKEQVLICLRDENHNMLQNEKLNF